MGHAPRCVGRPVSETGMMPIRQAMTKAAIGDGTVDGRLRRIEGRHNALVKKLRAAFAQGDLTEEGECAIEGIRIIEEAIRSGVKFRAVFFSQHAKSKAERLLPQIAAYAETLLLPDKLFASVVPSESPQGVAALARCKAFTLEEVVSRAQAGPLLAIAGVQDPGNLGTMIRSAEAFGAAGVLAGEGTASPFNSKAVRASAGSVFRVPITRAPLLETLDQFRERGVQMIATSSHKAVPLQDAELAGAIAVFVGSEGSGLPRELLKAMNQVVAIPHSASVESLNAGVAASIILYEIARRRG